MEKEVKKKEENKKEVFDKFAIWNGKVSGREKFVEASCCCGSG